MCGTMIYKHKSHTNSKNHKNLNRTTVKTAPQKQKTADSESAPRLSLPSVQPSAVSIKMYAFRSLRLPALFQEGEKKVETVQIPPQGTSGPCSSMDVTLIGLTSSYILCDTEFRC